MSTDQDQPQQSRLSNVFVPDDVVEAEEDDGEDIWEGQDYEYEEDDLFLSRDGADIDIGKLNLEERIKVNFSNGYLEDKIVLHLVYSSTLIVSRLVFSLTPILRGEPRGEQSGKQRDEQLWLRRKQLLRNRRKTPRMRRRR